ncbi:MAG: adenosine deaminase [Acidobacteriota bacterium]
MSLRGFLQAIPKVELHVHLEGSMAPDTLWALARRHRVDLPANDLTGLRRWFRFRDFEHFVEIYLTLSACLKDAEDIHRLATDFLAEQARQNVVYSEVHFTISTHVANGLEGEAVMQALETAAAEAKRRHDIEVRWIPDIVRNNPVERADTTIEWALAGRGRGVVALGLAGMEKGFTNDPFLEHFAAARAAGLHRVAHAGEHAGPESVWSALEDCGAERIGHGVRAIEDASLVAELARRGVPVEVCPSSNLCLGVFPEMAHHSFDALRRAGVAVSVNSDDPPLFDTTLSDEYWRLAQAFGYDAGVLVELARAAFDHAFVGSAERQILKQRFEREVAACADREGVALTA